MYFWRSVYQDLYTVRGERFIISPDYEVFPNRAFEVESAGSTLSTPQLEVSHGPYHNFGLSWS